MKYFLNQDRTHLAVGGKEGFFVYDVNTNKEILYRNFPEGINIVEMWFHSNIYALVTQKDPHQVIIWDDFSRKALTQLTFRSGVINLKLNRKKLVVVLENQVCIYRLKDQQLIDCIFTYDNPKGLCCLNVHKNNIIMVCLGKALGQVHIDLCYQNRSYLIDAHNTAISEICLSLTGERLATSSQRGTLIRIFDTPTGQLLKEFRRGSSQASIQSMAFSENGSSLAVLSDHRTVHIYSCVDTSQNLQSTFSFMSGLVSYLGSTWSSHKFSIPETNSIITFNKEADILVITYSGELHKYNRAGKLLSTNKITV